MEFETVERSGRVHVVENGVESANYVKSTKSITGQWVVMTSRLNYIADTRNEALERIAESMGTWYTIAQASERLVELGAFTEPPSRQMMGTWCRKGQLPGAFKAVGAGCRGGGGSWRIPASALPGFMEWRKGK